MGSDPRAMKNASGSARAVEQRVVAAGGGRQGRREPLEEGERGGGEVSDAHAELLEGPLDRLQGGPRRGRRQDALLLREDRHRRVDDGDVGGQRGQELA